MDDHGATEIFQKQNTARFLPWLRYPSAAKGTVASEKKKPQNGNCIVSGTDISASELGLILHVLHITAGGRYGEMFGTALQIVTYAGDNVNATSSVLFKEICIIQRDKAAPRQANRPSRATAAAYYTFTYLVRASPRRQAGIASRETGPDRFSDPVHVSHAV